MRGREVKDAAPSCPRRSAARNAAKWCVADPGPLVRGGPCVAGALTAEPDFRYCSGVAATRPPTGPAGHGRIPMQITRVVLIGLALAALVGERASAQERAQDYPSRQVNFMVP